MNSAAAPASFLAVNSLRMVQVGLGPHGRNWARQVLPHVSEIDVVAYVDTDPNALDALCRETGVPTDRCFESLKEAIGGTEPQGLLNTTALPGHVPVTRAALEAQPLLDDMSIHPFDLLRMILGREPDRVYCEAWNPRWTSFSGPSVAVATIIFDGVVVSYRGSWISSGPITPWAGEWSMEFEHGEVVWTSAADSDVTQDRVEIRPRNGKARTVALPPLQRTGTSGTLTEFARAIRTRSEPETSGRDNLGTIALTAAAVESATLREPVTIYPTGKTTCAAAAI